MFSLPLLTKDLIEQSTKRRTYVLRVIYAVILYGSALWVYAEFTQSGVMSVMGEGRQLFQSLTFAQIAAVFVLLPAICCGAITSEKERDTLGLLLITKLSPRTIIREKLFSRLFTMATYQLLSLPLYAIIYGMGGVELSEILAAVLIIAAWSLAVASWSIYFSAWHRTTTGAFIASYSVIPLIMCLLSCFPIWGMRGNPSVASQSILPIALAWSVVLIIVSMALIIAASHQLVERAFVPQRNLLLETFKKLDTFFEELNQQTTRGVVLVHERDSGPRFSPIAWRETRKKSLGTVRYLFRLLVILEVPLILSIAFTITDGRSLSFEGPTTFFLTVLWPIAVVAVTIHTTNVLASERSRQTLDVLLVTPFSSDFLIFQKLAGVRRLIGVLSVPFATLLIFQIIWTLYVQRGLEMFRGDQAAGSKFWHEILGMAFAMAVYPRLVEWIAWHFILRMKNQTQAVLLTFAVVMGICGIPFLLRGLVIQFDVSPAISDVVTWLSPVRILFHQLFVDSAMRLTSTSMQPSLNSLHSQIVSDGSFVKFAGHVIIFALLLMKLRSRAYRDFSSLVGRTEPDFLMQAIPRVSHVMQDSSDLNGQTEPAGESSEPT